LISWEERQKFHQWWGEIPQDCLNCEKTGILLESNFHQKTICLDPECWEKKQKEQRKREREELKKREKTLEDERRKVWDVQEFDIRHWRLAVAGLIDNWDLKKLLGLKRDEWGTWGGHADKEMLKKIQELSEEECKRLLIRHAAEEILTGPQRWMGEGAAKIWAVETFNLKREVFLGEEDSE